MTRWADRSGVDGKSVQRSLGSENTPRIPPECPLTRSHLSNGISQNLYYECASYSTSEYTRTRWHADNIQGDFEAVAYHAFSITRTTTPTSSRTRDWNASDDIRAVEAELRQDLHLVAQDASRPWLWLFKPTTVDKIEPNVDLPELDGYRLHSMSLSHLPKITTDTC